ncbi:MAG: hypothetical protein MPK31_08415 [Gammaproteobacteria bacterium]|nr:hypothetical protein [Gammaproteobacteria bacterium]
MCYACHALPAFYGSGGVAHAGNAKCALLIGAKHFTGDINMSEGRDRSSNDQRSDVKNPNNDEYEADMENRENLGHFDDDDDDDDD